ncbi:MAG: ABC transporter permease [Deltaproteobacteria bacterium]|nr:ABC transporter permease [Deltaproteobacteria bacterium]
MAIPISYNIRNAIQRPVSTLAAVVGIAMTIMILIGALSLANGFQAALTSTGSADNVKLLRKGADSEISSGVTRDAASIVRAHDDVAVGEDGRPMFSPEVVVVVVKDRIDGSGSSNVVVRGVDPEAAALRREVKVTQGRMFAPGADEVIVGSRIAARFAGLAIGDTVKFGQTSVKVVGSFEAGGSAFDSEVWGDNAVLMPAFRGDVFQTVVFRMKDPSRFDALKKELEDDSRLGVQVKRETEFYAAQSEMLANLVRFIGVFVTAIMGVGAIFGAMNTMFNAVGQRVREISIMLVLGFHPFVVMLSFLGESVMIALAGGVLGCLLALPLNGLVTSTTNFMAFSEIAFAFQVTSSTLVAGMIAAGVLGFVGGLLPAWRAARQPLIAGLRGG